MNRFYLAALWMATAAPWAHAQAIRATAGRGVVSSPLIVPAAPAALGLPANPFLGTLSPGLTPALPSLPANLPGRQDEPIFSALPAPSALPSPSPIGLPAAPSVGHKGALPTLQESASLLDSAAKGQNSLLDQRSGLGSLFEGARGALPGDLGFEAVRPPDGWENENIRRAVETVYRSKTGAQIYDHMYRLYGNNFKVKIDDDRSAIYNARLAWEGGSPVLYLTENLVDRRTSDVAAAYIVRELADIFYQAIPVSADRGYLSYGAMLETFIEAGNGWPEDITAYYRSWTDAVKGTYQGRYRTLQDSSFFRDFLTTGRDDSNIEPNAKLTLRQQRDRGIIGWQQYTDAANYVDQVYRSHVQFLQDKGHW